MDEIKNRTVADAYREKLTELRGQQHEAIGQLRDLLQSEDDGAANGWPKYDEVMRLQRVIDGQNDSIRQITDLLLYCR